MKPERFGPIFGVIGGVAAAFVVVWGDKLAISAAVTVLGMICLFLRRRDLVLALTAATVIAGSSTALLTEGVFYGRFAMYGILIAANVLHPAGPRRSKQGTGLLAFASLFALLAACSALWSVDPGLSLQRAISFALLIGAVATASIYQWPDPARLRGDFVTIAKVSAAVGILNVVAFAWGPQWVYSGVRFRGFLQNPNTIGVLVAFTLPIMLALWIESRGSDRLGWAVASAASAFTLAASQSRGGVVAAAIACTVLLWVGPVSARGTKVLALSALATGALLAVMLAPSLRPAGLDALLLRFQGAGNAAGGSGRVAAWALARDIWFERPFVGWGFGTTEQIFSIRAELEIDQVFEGSHPHNAFLETAMELGPIGLILIAAVVLFLIRSAARRHPGAVMAALAGSLVGGLVFMFVESGVTSGGSIFGLMFWMVAFGASYRVPSPTPQQASGSGCDEAPAVRRIYRVMS